VSTTKPIRVAFCGFPGTFNPDQISRLLRKRFNLIIDRENPEYVIYSVFSDEFLRYPDAIRIFFTGENVRPDFNLCDYAFSYDWLDFGDRHVRCPNYQLYDHFKEICDRRKTEVTTVPAGRRFCNFIYTNGNAHPFRDELFQALSAARRVDSPGRHLNNTSESIGAAYQGDWSTPKVGYQRQFRFSFAFENSSTLGYTTEKIVHALAADTIPIYWGNPQIGREFNSKRFINCHDFSSKDEILNRILEVDRNEKLYHQILSEPYFPGDRVPDELSDASILEQFEHIFSQSPVAALRRNREAWGKRYEAERVSSAGAKAFLESPGILSFAARRLFSLWRRSSRAAKVRSSEP